MAVWIGLVAPASAQVPGDPYSLPRVGAEVDAAERAYFLLFPTLDGSAPVTLTWSDEGDVRVAAASGDAFVMRLAQADELGRVLEQYERLFDDPEADVGQISRLLRWRKPSAPRSPVVATLRDREARGWLLMADSSGLVLSPTPDVPSEERLEWIPAGEVVRIRAVGFRSRLDARTRGEVEAYRLALASLHEAAVLLRGLPPELHAWRRARPSHPEAVRPPDRRFDGTPLNRWEVGASVLAGVVDAGTTTTDPIGIPPPTEESWVGWATGVGVRVGYNVTPRLGVEVAARAHGSELMNGRVLDGRQYLAVVGDLVASYDVLPPRIRGLSLTGRLGVSGGRAWSTTELSYRSDQLPYAGFDRTRTRLGDRVGGLVGAGVAYRASRGLSLGADLGWTVLSGLDEDEVILLDATLGVPLKRVAARTTALQFRGLEAGVTFHLGEW